MSGEVRADAIVSRAKDTYVPPGDRAVEALKSIVREYYDVSILFDVIYDENEGGLATSLIGGISDIKGKVTVGKYFEHIDAFAQRILQVAHELQQSELAEKHRIATMRGCERSFGTRLPRHQRGVNK